MKKITISLLSIAVLTLLGCSSNSNADLTKDLAAAMQDLQEEIDDVSNTVTKEVGGLYSIDIPADLTITTSLNDDASLQYNNTYAEKYVIVIDEDKQNFIDVLKSLGAYDKDKSLADELADIQISSFGENMTISSQSKVIETEINGMDVRLFAFDGYAPSIDQGISYWTGYFVGEENLYTVMIWTLESSKSVYEDEANAMLQSLTELK
ncbi:MAG: hypothetical protein COA33_010495 [Fluviicola sp.]|nr:hypothetical protein [Fluviicola sp.]